jgi:hypothetical protein
MRVCVRYICSSYFIHTCEQISDIRFRDEEKSALRSIAGATDVSCVVYAEYKYIVLEYNCTMYSVLLYLVALLHESH